MDSLFMGLFVTGQLVGLLAVLLVLYWSVFVAGGFGFSASLLFQWHPLFGSIGTIYLLGNAILIFRLFADQDASPSRLCLKRMHAAGSVAGLLLTVGSVLVVLVRPHRSTKAYLYSMHSWLGMLAVVLYVAQALVSVAAFLLDVGPLARPTIKARLLPVHVFVGLTIFVLGVAAGVTGFHETAIFKLKGNYPKLGTEAILANSIGVLYTLFGICIVYLSTYKFAPKKVPALPA